MVFSSIPFLFFFLVIFFIFYFLVPKKYKNIILLIFSLIFYAWGEPIYILIMIFSSLVDYYNGMGMLKYDNNPKIRKRFLIISIIVNLSLLFFFKYIDFFIGVTNSIFNLSISKLNIPLPIGISFFTFQTMSYSIDVYRRKINTEHSLIDFMTYVSMFPQLIAGPIVRYSTIEKELKSRTTSIDSFSEGIKRFMVGFAKKIVFANALGRICDLAFNELGYYKMGALLSIFVIICYSMQIYLDFWAYSDMAIGIGKIFGFTFLENFNNPFLSTSISEFWTRWHISLSSFFKDYVYIPLGGNKKGLLRTCINLTIVFALSGFWHGANFNFLFWGLYNALFLVIERIIKVKAKFRVPPTIGIIYVFIVWNIGMILFRLDSLNQVALYLNGLFNSPLYNYSTRELLNIIFTPTFAICFFVSVLYLTPLFDKIKYRLNHTKYGYIIVDTVIAFMFIYAVIEMLTSGFNPFLYFRF